MNEEKTRTIDPDAIDHDKALDETVVLADEVDRYASGFLSAVQVTGGNDIELLMLAMAVRSINFFRGVKSMSREGLAQPAASCLRSLLEQVWVFGAIANESTRDKAVERLIGNGEHSRSRGVKNLRKLSLDLRDPRITDELLDGIEMDIDQAIKHDLSEWAKLAQRVPEYLTSYARLCDQTHPSINSIEKHLVFNDLELVTSVTSKPDLGSLAINLNYGSSLMIDVIALCPKAWLTDLEIQEAKELRSRVNSLWDRLPDQFPHEHD